MPIYNKEYFLNRSLNSIKEQTLKDIEIIAVNDFSTDNTLKILKEFSYKDRRIKIINNDRNHGLLYSRAMGILNCTGEYLINMDPDDKLSNENDLKRLYKIGKKYKSDFIEYELKRIYSFKDKNFQIYKKSLNYKVSSTKKKIEELITNKFIKREIILKAYKYFEKYIFNYKWVYHEDNVWHRLILKYSQLKLYFNEIIYIYFKNNPNSLMHTLGNQLEHKNRLSYYEMTNEIEKPNILESIYSLLDYIKSTIKNDIESRKKLIRIIIKNINNDKLSNFELKKIKTILNKLSSHKLIIIHDNKSHYKNMLMKFFNLYKFNEIFNEKIIEILDINNRTVINNYLSYIYIGDIFLGYKNIYFNSNFTELISIFPKNKFLLLNNNSFPSDQLMNLYKYPNLYLLNLNNNYSFLNFAKIIRS